ncbi:urea ABC transporter permease subunit UrtC [Nocardioides sp. GY 10113]|uniref:urea ABC transporter permease subunit UrtC n=1 Tax=Nocardioides sp. GY 10113 TaxID=2569761 RepID=UPI0010A85464|nr:urea ABC transporter permease subunit UrtC [Nocardioides sp. GY 10113]TIC87667.1 urea ABC transporter permease subunit UrtC [Nocardioides sp. GY 10113]
MSAPEAAPTATATRALRAAAPLIGIAVLALLLLVVAPAVLSQFRLNNLGKYCCYAIAAVGIGIAWGRGGMLVLGQGLFFGIGAYAMGMHLKLEAAESTGGVPDFMLNFGDGTLPAWWEPFRSGAFTVAAIIVLPALLAALLGFSVFKRRIKGAYFAILSQALTVAFAALLVSQIKYTGGQTGLNSLSSFFGYNLYDPANRQMLFYITAGLLIAMLVVTYQLYRSRFGELLVAVRDAEERVRFLGHDPANIKVVAFVVAAIMASIGGAMFVPLAGLINPREVNALASIMLIAGVALGGRAALLGPALGALAVGFGRTYLSESFPEQWTYFLGALFIVVILFIPAGLASVLPRLWARWRPAPSTPAPAQQEAPA